jgi:divalent metal cation (Fe/Co/Zn/Cd) transporter
VNRTQASEFPPDQQRALRKARRLEWITIAYLVSAIGILALVLGSSQAMRTAWAEDILSLIPPIAFLIAMR